MLYMIQKLKKAVNILQKNMIRERIPVTGIRYCPTGYNSQNEKPDPNTLQDFPGDLIMHAPDSHFWFTGSFRTSPQKDGCRPMLHIYDAAAENDPQSLLYLNGALVQGMDRNHLYAYLQADTMYNFDVYFYANVQNRLAFRADVVMIDEATEGIYYDIEVPLRAIEYLNGGREQSIEDENAIKMIKALEIAVNCLNFQDPYSAAYYEGINAAREYLKKEFYQKECGKSSAVVDCIGHTHLDVAWLWTLAQTREKVQRSFSTVLSLMEKYPDYKFMSSQPQLYAYLKEESPETFEKIKKRVKEGRWEADGAMWLEADCNITGGESFIRQILYGKRFMKEEFGVDSHTLWLPDVFGYSACLPQILKKSGVDNFVTAKISWNDHNRAPADSFLWEGIDGSRVYAYFLTNHEFGYPDQSRYYVNFNGEMTPHSVKSVWDYYQQKDYSDEVLYTYGFGDGGGGPTAEMLEREQRLSYGLPGYPRTRLTTLREFLQHSYEKFEDSCKKLKHTPTWIGELYLEYHRGTYTSMARNKRSNRKSEFLLQRSELACTLDRLLLGNAYPKAAFDGIWKKVLLNQFHDIVPGSSIKEVYDDSAVDYAWITSEGEKLLSDALGHIRSRLNTKGGILLYNPRGYESKGYVRYKGVCAYTDNLPAFGWKVVSSLKTKNAVKVGERSLENAFFRLAFDEYGGVDIFDKRRNRPLFQAGKHGNVFRAFEDRPYLYDAWEIANYYEQKEYDIPEKAVFVPIDDGARSGLQIRRRFRNSTIIQNVYLYDELEEIVFENEIDWKESETLLKVDFPFAVHTDRVKADIAFGYVERSSNRNTSWEQAKFEMCMHKWVDVSEDNFGISLLNDCKYGYSSNGADIALTVLKCAMDPNPTADREKHIFTYSIYPHDGSPTAGGSIRHAYSLNADLVATDVEESNGSLPEQFSFVSADRENILLETVKQAEDGSGIILRAYDAYNRKEQVTLTFAKSPEAVFLCDMMENTLEPLPLSENRVTLPIGNFEIVTLKAIF